MENNYQARGIQNTVRVIRTPLNKKLSIAKKLKKIAARLKNEGHPNSFNEASRLINLKYGENF